ncbi:MAG: hypothetical protein M0P64_02425 [Candidatus Pacebacteria bacterium]|jgi:hypothetical protein|nr:hypothetical protein [Candidatus Paceibacterota bacterium]
MCHIKAGNGNSMIRVRTPHAKDREGDGSKAFAERIAKERNSPNKEKEANRRTRARRSLRRAAQRIQAAHKNAQEAGEAGLEKLINFFQRKSKEAV